MSLAGGVLTAVSTAPPRAIGSVTGALLRAHGTVVRSSALSGDEPPVTIPRDPAREAARRELSKQMYHQNDPSLVQRALDAIWNWIDKLFSRASEAAPGGTLGLLVVVLAVLVVGAALWWRLGTPRRQPGSAAALFEDGPRSAAEHRSAAEAHAAQGHWNPAVQERMRAIVRALEERALLDARPGRTADEAVAEASRALPTHTAELRAAAAHFDDVTYGGRGASEQSYRRIAELDRELERTRPVLTSSAHSTAHHTSQGAAE
ncbi:DUF4129 domain-containing protein [Streptomyces sp. NBC_00696]|uniref:DUF4129 domain-containing protein n=1 Tax=Streptomyces sp. NBC_00696 TaxID=2903672 RepID=UPI003FA6E5AF